ncbi:hypothetical protein MIV058R [Invertebrate iridescent virus 3]|uniref:Uncharacterized protein 058R n=1 Tax=Invertebrate iridescent virus 3 TaxID=345201 RepID=VF391_IIV3|nr:hypothetical protein MIV058R [Invertebrate iridescent virus 3]Q197A2.1 RecName: Full=Uncharacterized protein 058R [Invertebrate iridescent virus 3]ABF82088.1 hypothetical protein MIV058R [Invertebrate iridescent virus 3]
MLQNVIKELYDKGVLIFLDPNNYVTNNVAENPEIFANRDKFLEMYQDPIKIGWIFCYTPSLEEVLSTIKEDTCCLIEFGFNSDTEKKACETGRLLINHLVRHKFMAHWDENAIKNHKISTVITAKDLPESIQDLIVDYAPTTSTNPEQRE